VLGLVDEAHWLDRSSAEALAFAARRLEAEGVALVFAARDGDPRDFPAPGLPELRLEGLGPEPAAALLAGAGVELPAGVVDRLVGRTGGNPLALLELPPPTSTPNGSAEPASTRLPYFGPWTAAPVTPSGTPTTSPRRAAGAAAAGGGRPASRPRCHGTWRSPASAGWSPPSG
jgi:hypothetical protein